MKKVYLILSLVGIFIILVILLVKIAIEVHPLFTEKVGFLLFLYAASAFYIGYIVSIFNGKRDKKKKK